MIYELSTFSHFYPLLSALKTVEITAVKSGWPWSMFLTWIAKEKKTSNSSYLIQSWMRSNTTIQYLRMWEKIHNPKFQEDACDELILKVHSTSTTLTPSLWISTTHAMGMKTSRGKGGGTTAHPEIAEMFRAWLFPEFMLELVQWYRSFYHGNNNDIVGSR